MSISDYHFRISIHAVSFYGNTLQVAGGRMLSGNLLFQKYAWKSSFSLAISPEICYTILYLIVILGSEKHGNVSDSL